MKISVFGLALVAILLISTSAGAVNIELALCIDGSGSISASEFTLQKDGYHDALDTLLPTDGSVAIGVWQFSTGVQQEFALTVIDSPQVKTNLLAAIANMTQLGDLTAIADAIDEAATALVDTGIDGNTLIIDVSTDGVDTVGGDPAAAASNALAAGVDNVNGLGIGAGADLSWVPATSMTWTAVNFQEFPRIITAKLRTELVPEPTTLALLGLGLVGLVALRRRRT